MKEALYMKEVSREYREEKCFIRKKYLEKIRKIRVSEFFLLGCYVVLSQFSGMVENFKNFYSITLQLAAADGIIQKENN